MPPGCLLESMVVSQKPGQTGHSGAWALRESRHHPTGQRAEPTIFAAQNSTTSLDEAIEIPGTREKRLGQAADHEPSGRKQWWGPQPDSSGVRGRARQAHFTSRAEMIC